MQLIVVEIFKGDESRDDFEGEIRIIQFLGREIGIVVNRRERNKGLFFNINIREGIMNNLGY